MAFDGIVTKSVISELNNKLIGAKVNKILEPTKNEIVLELYTNGQKYNLLLSCDSELCRISLTTHLKPNPQNALNFCMLLRKYLTGGKVLEISNYDLERTIEIKFSCYNELNDLVVRKLFLEIMSRQSNIILTNENNIIIDSIKHFDNSTRELLPAHEYTYAPITKQSFLSIKSCDEFIKLIDNTSILQQLQNKFIGFSKIFIKSILSDLNIGETNLNKSELSNLYKKIHAITDNINTNKISCINFENDFVISNTQKTDELQINNFIDKFYYEKEINSTFKKARNELLHIVEAYLKKVTKKLDNINNKLKECNNLETYKLYGELLTANLYRLDSCSNLNEIELENYYNNNETIKIPLDQSISIQQNIKKYYKKYNKLKNALVIVSEQKKDAEKELNYIESIVFSLENAQNIKNLDNIFEEVSENLVSSNRTSKKLLSKKNISKKEIEIASIEFKGFTIYVGHNNIQNEYLTLKFANRNDIWFHAQQIHGSHVVLKNPNLEIDDIPDDIIEKCALLAKENSKAANDTGANIDYCYIKNVKKAPSGKTGMVHYTNYKTIYIKNTEN